MLDLLIASVVQTVLDNTLQKIVSTTRPRTSGRRRQDSEAHTRQQTTLRRTEWLSRNAASGESKCGQQRSTSRRLSTPLTHKFNLESTQILRYQKRQHQPPEERFTETRQHLYRPTRRATCSRSRKEPNGVILCQACFWTRFYRIH